MSARQVWRQRLLDLLEGRLILRRLAFAAEAVDRVLPSRNVSPLRAFAFESARLEDARIVVAVSHWRYAEPRPTWNDDEILLSCLRALMEIPTTATHVIVHTNDGAATEELLRGSNLGKVVVSGYSHYFEPTTEALHPSGKSVRVVQPRLRWPRKDGRYLTWAHKNSLKRALKEPWVTHLVYLEDDIGFTETNLRYWLSARAGLAGSAFIPGFLRYEKFLGQRCLVEQSEPGQHRVELINVAIPNVGRISMVRPELPYQASYIMDRELAYEHFARSAFRSPFRSRVAAWGVRERAAAGPLFTPTLRPVRDAARIGSAPNIPPSRSVVPVQIREGPLPRYEVLEGALLEHLRPVYSTNPTSRNGKLPVSDF